MQILSKISYRVQDQNTGKWKTITEQFLHDAVTYGDVEAQLAKLLEGRVTDYDYSLSKVTYAYIYDTFLPGDFYVVTILTQEGIDEKKTSEKHLVVAESITDAEERAAKFTRNWVQSVSIEGAVHSKILGYWHPNNEQWQDDFKQRMARLAEEGNKSADANQLNLFSDPVESEMLADEVPFS